MKAEETSPVSSYRIGIQHGNLEGHHIDRVAIPEPSAAPPRRISSAPPSSGRVTPSNAMECLRELELATPRAGALYRRARLRGLSSFEAVAEVSQKIRQVAR